ncbi:MAG: DUF3987 domain-containing protein [Chloroflexota bacterium]|nr:MAG: DUF3987 domain-containing protein [Chloroflexota bacterium]
MTDQAITICRFQHAKDNRPKAVALTWNALAKLLTTHQERTRKEGPLFSPTVYRPNTTRANGNVEVITAAVGDFDHGTTSEDLKARLEPYAHVLYSTYSSTAEAPRFRAVVRLARPIPASEWTAGVWEQINGGIFGGQNDPQTKDPARIYYLPSCPPGALRFVESHDGRPLDPDELPAVSATIPAPIGTEPHPNGKTWVAGALPVGRDAWRFVAEGAPDGSQRGRAVAAARNFLSAGYSVEDTAAKIWLGLKASPWDAAKGPWTEEEAKAIVRDLAQKPAPPIKARQKDHQRTNEPEWEPPTPFFRADVPVFPTDIFPSWLRAFVEAEATATQTPPDLAGMLVLSGVSTACAKKVVVRVRDGWREPVNVYVVVILPPGARKSAVFSDAAEPLEQYERAEAERLGPEIAEDQTRYRIAKSRLEHVQSQAAKAKPDEAGALAQQAADLSRELAVMTVPELPRLIVDDCTPEKASTLLRDQGGRLAVLAPEGDVFDLMAARYGNAPNFGVFLRGHAGDNLRVDRVGRPPEFVPQPALTVGLAVQPEVVRGLMGKPGLRGRGLLARFLFSWPASTVGHRDVKPPAVPESIRATYHRRMLDLLRLPFGTDQDGNSVAHTLTLSTEAWGVLEDFMRWLEPLLGEYGELHALADWGSKLAGAVVRIAGLLHMAGQDGESPAWRYPIAGQTMEAAIRLGHYLIPHARLAFAEMGADRDVEDARYVWRWIERAELDTFTKRDAHRGCRGRFTLADEIDPALGLLEAHHFIRERESEEEPKPGRPPSPVYEVNPLARGVLSIVSIVSKSHAHQKADEENANASGEEAEGMDTIDTNATNPPFEVGMLVFPINKKGERLWNHPVRITGVFEHEGQDWYSLEETTTCFPHEQLERAEEQPDPDGLLLGDDETDEVF